MEDMGIKFRFLMSFENLNIWPFWVSWLPFSYRSVLSTSCPLQWWHGLSVPPCPIHSSTSLSLLSSQAPTPGIVTVLAAVFPIPGPNLFYLPPTHLIGGGGIPALGLNTRPWTDEMTAVHSSHIFTAQGEEDTSCDAGGHRVVLGTGAGALRDRPLNIKRVRHPWLWWEEVVGLSANSTGQQEALTLYLGICRVCAWPA